MRSALFLLGALLLAGTALGQSSPGFNLEEHVLNAGGTPAQGLEPSSASFRITLASIGGGMAARGLSSESFEMDLSFVAGYPPPGEVAAGCGALGASCLMFTDDQTLIWPAERSAVTYNLYSDSTSDHFGTCDQQGLGGTTTMESMVPPSGAAHFYLVTAENRLGEEGTKGFSVNGVTMIERGGAVCP